MLRFPLAMLCFLGLGAEIELGSLVIPSFIPGCEQFPPRITSRYFVPGKPIARDRFAQVDVYLRGREPERFYVVIGEVEVLARSRNTSLSNMIEYASNEARKMGGEALVDVWPRQAHAADCSDPRGRHLLTAKIVRWSLASG